METERIKSQASIKSLERIATAEIVTSPEGVRELMAELWANHVCGNDADGKCRVYMVDLPAPGEDDLCDMALGGSDQSSKLTFSDLTSK